MYFSTLVIGVEDTTALESITSAAVNPYEGTDSSCNAMAVRDQEQFIHLCDTSIEFEAKKSEEIPSTTSTSVEQDVIDWEGPEDAW